MIKRSLARFLWIAILSIIFAACSRMVATPIALPTGMSTNTVSPIPTATIAARSYYDSLPAGQYLVYHDTNSTGISTNLRVISTDGTVNQLLVELGGRTGESFVFSRGSVEYDVYNNFRILDLKSNNIIDIPKPIGQECGAGGWSPDGTQVVIKCSNPNNHLGNEEDFIALLSLPNGEITILLNNKNSEYPEYDYEQPQWSPDGKWLFFYQRPLNKSGSTSPKEALFITDMSCISDPSTCQSKTRRLSLPADYYYFSIADWTPDNHLALAWQNQINIYDIVSGQQIHSYQAIPGNQLIYSMACSPDGKWIAIAYIGPSGVWLIPVEGGQASHLGQGAFFDRPHWITVP